MLRGFWTVIWILSFEATFSYNTAMRKFLLLGVLGGLFCISCQQGSGDQGIGGHEGLVSGPTGGVSATGGEEAAPQDTAPIAGPSETSEEAGSSNIPVCEEGAETPECQRLAALVIENDFLCLPEEGAEDRNQTAVETASAVAVSEGEVVEVRVTDSNFVMGRPAEPDGLRILEGDSLLSGPDGKVSFHVVAGNHADLYTITVAGSLRTAQGHVKVGQCYFLQSWSNPPMEERAPEAAFDLKIDRILSPPPWWFLPEEEEGLHRIGPEPLRTAPSPRRVR